MVWPIGFTSMEVRMLAALFITDVRDAGILRAAVFRVLSESLPNGNPQSARARYDYAHAHAVN